MVGEFFMENVSNLSLNKYLGSMRACRGIKEFRKKKLFIMGLKSKSRQRINDLFGDFFSLKFFYTDKSKRSKSNKIPNDISSVDYVIIMVKECGHSQIASMENQISRDVVINRVHGGITSLIAMLDIIKKDESRI